MNNKPHKKSGVFSFKINKKMKPSKHGKTINSTAETAKDGTYTIIDRFTIGPSSFDQALNSPKIFSDPETYVSELRKFLDITKKLSFNKVTDEKEATDGK